ncbi:MAG: PAS domain-containing protein [Actinobacteria bacterium]|nr:PAS domain-containing protein [Actinomycetota bacterium]
MSDQDTTGEKIDVLGKFTHAELIQARQAVFDTAVDTIYIFNIDDLKILDMNPWGLEQLGFTIEEVRQKNFYDLHAIEERERAEEIVAQYLRDGGIFAVRDLHLRRKDGTLIPVEKTGRLTEVNGKQIGH